jgi:hypothetical protein
LFGNKTPFSILFVTSGLYTGPRGDERFVTDTYGKSSPSDRVPDKRYLMFVTTDYEPAVITLIIITASDDKLRSDTYLLTLEVSDVSTGPCIGNWIS